MRYLILILLLASCRTPERLHDLSIKRGLVHDTVIKKVKITDTIKGKDGKDSTIYRTVSVICPEPVIQKRWKVRFENKRFEDSLKHYRTLYTDSLKYALKQAKNDAKREVKVSKQENKSIFKRLLGASPLAVLVLFVGIMAVIWLIKGWFNNKL